MSARENPKTPTIKFEIELKTANNRKSFSELIRTKISTVKAVLVKMFMIRIKYIFSIPW